MKNNHRSLLFQYVGKKANNVIASFNEYPKMEPIDILNELQLKYDPTQVEEIILEDHELVVISEELKTKLEEFPNLESLGLNRCDLTTLKNLPDLKHLQRL